MDVQITPAAADEHDVLAALMQLYVYDFSEMLGLDVGDDGRFREPAIEGREAFLIRVDGKLAGFALIVGRSRLTGEDGVHDVAEFFVLQRYRRTGVGETAARWLFDRYPGPWEVRQRNENTRAIGRVAEEHAAVLGPSARVLAMHHRSVHRRSLRRGSDRRRALARAGAALRHSALTRAARRLQTPTSTVNASLRERPNQVSFPRKRVRKGIPVYTKGDGGACG